MGNNNIKPINIFIINSMEIKWIYDLFPERVKKETTYEERLFKEKSFAWKGIFYDKNMSLENIFNEMKKKILEIKEENNQNNIIIAKEINQISLFNAISDINKKLDIKILVIYISFDKLQRIKRFDNRRITNIYGNRINDKEFMKEKLRYILSMKDCLFNQRTFEFRRALNSNDIPTFNCCNIVVIGLSRAGKSTLCNTLINKYEALESSALETVTTDVNEYSNDYFHVFDTPGIIKNKALGDTSKIVIGLIKKLLKKVDDSKDDIHIIFFVLKYMSNLDEAFPVLEFLKEENEKRQKNGMKKIPIIFIVNEPRPPQLNDDEDDEFEDKFKETARGLKSFFENKKIQSLYDEEINRDGDEDEDRNIIRVDIRKEKKRIFEKIYFYLRKNNPFSEEFFKRIQKIKENFEIINRTKNDPRLTNGERDRLNSRFKRNKEECQKTILKISKENSFFNKIYSMENILVSSEIKATVAIAICCATTFGTGFIPIPFVDIPLVYAQQALMIISIAFSYGFSRDEIPFKAAVGAAFGITAGLGGGAIEAGAHVGVQKGGEAIIEKTITEAGSKCADKFVEISAKSSLEIGTKKVSEKVSAKLIEEGGKEIQEILIKKSIKEGGSKITEKITEKTLEFGSGKFTQIITSNIIKEGGEKVGEEIGKQILNEAGENVGKMATNQIVEEISIEIMKQSGKSSSAKGSTSEISKFIPFIGTIIGGTISGSINLASTVGMGIAVKKFFRHLVCLTAGADYILNKKRDIDKIFEKIRMMVNNNKNESETMEYVEVTQNN